MNKNADHEREKDVYRYLLSFTDLGLKDENTISNLYTIGADSLDKNKSKLPNESLIAVQWGSEKEENVGINRTYVKRVLRCVYGKSLYKQKDNTIHNCPGLSITKLVFILSSLEDYWKSSCRVGKTKKPSKVTHSVKIQAINMLSLLTPEERRLLSIPMPSSEGLVQKVYEDILNPFYEFRYEEITRIYQQFLISKTINSSKVIADTKSITIEKIISDHISTLTGGSLDESVSKNLQDRVLGEINRIEFQSGAEQLRSIDRFKKDKQIASMNNKMFVRHLTKCIVENEEITDEFPIRIKFFEIEKVRPLPLLKYKLAENEKGLINPYLVENDVDIISGLERQYSYRLTLHFFIQGEGSKIEFFEEITGIGSLISHAIVAIDRTLMWDIPCLKEYFPIARQQLSNDEVIGGNQNSAIWSHCVVQLFKKSEIENAIKGNQPLEEVSRNITSHYGEFCGFDIFETSVKSALIARLRAIKSVLAKNNVTSSEYIKELFNRIEESNKLRDAKNSLQYYPFSLGVMESKINSNIFLNGQKYRGRKANADFYDVEDEKRWSSIAYDAHLKITESFLKEGRTVVSRKYLNALSNHVKYLSALMLARYYFCYGQYYFLADLDSAGRSQNREMAILESEKFLNLAEESIKRRIRECELLGELSHSQTHPIFEIYSKISLVRSRLRLYFESYNQETIRWRKATSSLREAEQARIYSARDGSAILYFSQSCFEAWNYLILAFTWDFENEPQKGFSKELCIDWARRLLRHAIICYEKVGLNCYAQIKRNAGFMVDSEDRFGENVTMKGIPFIQEISPGENEENAESDKILNLDLSLFKTDEANLEGEKIFLPIFFGTDSCNIIFTQGMIELCETKESEFLYKNIIIAIRKFIVAWSTSRDGAYTKRTVEDGIEKLSIKDIFADVESKTEKASDTELLKKIDKNNDRYIRGFYPHRISKTAIFSKVFVGVCLMMIKCKEEEIEECAFKVTWEEIHEFISNLHEKDIPEEVPEYMRQSRFNGHLSEHIINIIKYFRDFEIWTKSPQCKSMKLAQLRNKIMKDIFVLIKGGSVMVN